MKIKSRSESREKQKLQRTTGYKKRWTEYILEFFMLFFAVFLGFIAENWREHLVESKKESDYMHALLLDLKTDTALIAYAITYNTNVYEADSSILQLLKLPVKDAETMSKMYQLNPIVQNFDYEINDSKTFDQLKSSGDYRLIKNKDVRNGIAKYYQRISTTRVFSNEIQRSLESTYTYSFKIFDQYSFDSNTGKMVPLITEDEAIIKEYSNRLYHLASSYKIYNNRFLKGLQKEATDLITLLNHTYP